MAAKKSVHAQKVSSRRSPKDEVGSSKTEAAPLATEATPKIAATTSSDLKPKPPAESLTRMTEIVLPQHTNALGTIFGGQLMSWIDIAAAIAAGRHAGRTCVTASIDQLHFLKPILKTYIVNIEARVTSVHNTSCEVMVTVEGESAAQGLKFHTAQAFLTFVSLGDNGRPTPMPPLKVTTNEEKTLQKHAELRREHRMALKRALEK